MVDGAYMMPLAFAGLEAKPSSRMVSSVRGLRVWSENTAGKTIKETAFFFGTCAVRESIKELPQLRATMRRMYAAAK